MDNTNPDLQGVSPSSSPENPADGAVSPGQLPSGGPSVDDQINDDLTDEDFDRFAHDDYILGGGATLPPPPPPSAPSEPRRLVRDPHALLGGVASGVAAYLGLDKAVVRVLFVIGALVTGVGFLLYPLAWIIIPRATVWPPLDAPAQRSARSLSPDFKRKEMVIAAAVLGVIVLFSLGDGPAQVLVPLTLIGAGVWLLRQPESATAGPVGVGPRVHTEPVGDPLRSHAPSSGAAPLADSVDEPTWGEGIPPFGATAATSMPVPPRSVPRRILRGGVIMALVAVPVTLLVAVAFVGVAIDGDSFAFSDAIITPISIEEIQNIQDVDAGSLTIDLSLIEPTMFTEGPESIDLDMKAGELRVLVPNDIPISVSAKQRIGEMVMFGQSQDGIGNSFEMYEGDAFLEFTVDSRFGLVEFVRVP